MAFVGQAFVKSLLKRFVTAISATLLFALFFILQYISDMEFQCPCQPGWHFYEALYFTAPPVILTWVLVYIESYNQTRICDKTMCCSFCLNGCSCVGHILLRFIHVFVIWVTALLFDGNWYFCHMAIFNSTYIRLPCKDPKKLTDEERVVRNGLKIQSLECGMILICTSFFIWTLFNGLWICWNRRQQSQTDQCCPPYYRVVYENLLAEKVREHLKEELSKIAVERAQKLCRPHLQSIKEDVEGNESKDSKKKPWHEISSSCFHMRPVKKQGEQTGSQETPGNRAEAGSSDETDPLTPSRPLPPSAGARSTARLQSAD